ncbi:MAG: hypothetical protein NVSMB63_06060 [Sediminibacterium sp.]
MKKYSWLIACLFTLSVTAQEKFVAMGKSPSIYIMHKAVSGESLASIAGHYGQTAAQLANFNHTKTSVVLKKGALVKVQLVPNNLSQHPSPVYNVPVYHIVQKGDNLYHISQEYYKINVASLREWNNLKKDIVRSGQPLIIGYVKGDKPGLSAKAGPKQVNNETGNINIGAPKATVIADAGSGEEGVVVKQPVAMPVPKEENGRYVPQQGDEGYFAASYVQHEAGLLQQFRSGDAATFKTISGWTDRKYYVLMNEVAPGTVVRITAPGNKSICAKVIGPLQETKGGAGLSLRMNNAAAITLGMTDPRFTVAITYFE